MSKRILTGITTTGIPHIGNYFGAIKPALQLSSEKNVSSYFFLADLHAIIKQTNPNEIKNSVNEVALESFINIVFPLCKKISNLCGKPLKDFMALKKDFSLIFNNFESV